ncbi:MAG: MogA/MoaB family molybdenum cofactor biosynthesis protein [Candidatus Sabulitectum sp.]|nr:MogA/MoaB family molybdenum cofactor biosynthesis protein [Candidatus Sabulitectum sp.]
MATFSVLTVSDSCKEGSRTDTSGPTITEKMKEAGYTQVDYRITEDGVEPVSICIEEMCHQDVDLLFTTGGTGFSSRDFTPEATEMVCDRKVPGIPEMLRYRSSEKVKAAWLSRGTAGIRGNTLVVNLPGSVKAVTECVEFLLPILPHALEVLRGDAGRCGG